MKKIALVPALLGFAAASFAVPAPAPQEVIEEVVAIVNNDIITLSQVRTAFDQAIAQLRAENLPQEDFNKQYALIKGQLLDSMITELLILQKAKEMDLNVSEQLKANLDKIKKDNNFTSDEDLRRAVESQGIPYEYWLKQYEETLLKQGVIFTEIDRSIVLDEAEIVQYYKKHPEEFTVPTEYTLRAVYLASGTRGAEALAALRKEIDDKVTAGAAFEDVAAEMSDPPVKDLKGDLGTVKQGDLDPTLEQAVAKLKDGEISPWVEAKNGWYLIKLEKKVASFIKPFDEAKPQVQDKLFGEKREKKSEEYLATLKARSYVKILRPNPLDY
jgi:peptidyl-prolyl cis-trans isomerase SurA